jgi:hypothetical protein
MELFLAAGGGFLVAVIWMDLMFDVLAFAPAISGPGGDSLPDEALARITTYYRRVTTEASPMDKLISAVMTGMVAILVAEVWEGGAGRMLAAASLACCGVPIVLALTRIVPNAVRLGSRRDDAATQSRLARGILFDHLACIAAMLLFLVIRFYASS